MRIGKQTPLLLCAALCAALLAGCMRGGTATPGPSPSASPASPTASPTPQTAESAATGESAGHTAAGLARVLDGCLAFAADTAGGSLKAATAAGDLVRYTAQYGRAETFEADAKAWYTALDADQKAQLALNWPGIRDTARGIAAGSEQAAAQLADAGVSADFTGVDLAAASAAIDRLDSVFAAPSA